MHVISPMNEKLIEFFDLFASYNEYKSSGFESESRK